MRIIGWTLCAVAALFVLANRAALAADVYSVALPKELYSALLDYAFLGISTLLAWAIKRGADLLHVRRESLLVERLEQGMTYALMYAREKALMKGSPLTDFSTRSELVAVAAGYLLPKMPALLKDLRIDAEGLKERLTGRLDLVAPLDPTAPTPPLG
ncbi:hypothetical protein [Azospirillum agricola]|uniref:hypothetical protein n=1 Tax=Azospirillum agricola TaxID=1720247 RepID=UPI000A0F012B|nr:hypothetical protein [Azospirillum agricola]SMH62549.1 hypothetical protein SAMN02982994_6352 [Azospirillum lipoferum]